MRAPLAGKTALITDDTGALRAALTGRETSRNPA